MPKSGHVTITKNENLHTDTSWNNHWFQKCSYFRITTITRFSRKTRWRTVASLGTCECLAVLIWRSSSIHASSDPLVHVRCLLCHSTVLWALLKYIIKYNNFITKYVAQPDWHNLYLTSRRAGLSASAELLVYMFALLSQWWDGPPKCVDAEPSPPGDGECMLSWNALLFHACYQTKFRRSSRFDVITEMRQVLSNYIVLSFKVTQGHWNWQNIIAM